MKLLPSLRQKKRYVVFEIISPKKISRTEIEKEVNQALFNFLGQLGVAQAAPLFIKEKFNQPKSQKLRSLEDSKKKPLSQRFILKINHQYPNQAKAALTLIKKIKNTSVIFKSLITTGTIKKAYGAMIK